MPHTEAKRTTIVTLTLAILVAGFAATANAQRSNPCACAAPQTAALTFDLSALPPLDSIGAQTSVAAFMQSGVPAELQRTALRLAWSTDPAIRDFKELQENDWDFVVANSVPGFGDFAPDFDVQPMLARLFGEPTRVAARTSTRTDYIYDSVFLFLANWLLRPVLGAIQN